jgi:hypothetical protein
LEITKRWTSATEILFHQVIALGKVPIKIAEAGDEAPSGAGPNGGDSQPVSYGTDRVDEMRQAAAYIDRILRGEKPADLPVQAPTKFENRRQSQDSEGTRRNDTAGPFGRRRGDRVTGRMSAFGP